MSDFDDYEPDDAYDTEPADPEQVARKLHALRRREGLEAVDWDDLDTSERLLLVTLIARLLSWLRRQGSLR